MIFKNFFFSIINWEKATEKILNYVFRKVFDEEFKNHNKNAEILMENALKLMTQLLYLTQLQGLISQNSPI